MIDAPLSPRVGSPRKPRQWDGGSRAERPFDGSARGGSLWQLRLVSGVDWLSVELRRCEHRLQQKKVDEGGQMHGWEIDRYRGQKLGSKN